MTDYERGYEACKREAVEELETQACIMHDAGCMGDKVQKAVASIRVQLLKTMARRIRELTPSPDGRKE